MEMTKQDIPPFSEVEAKFKMTRDAFISPLSLERVLDAYKNLYADEVAKMNKVIVSWINDEATEKHVSPLFTTDVYAVAIVVLATLVQKGYPVSIFYNIKEQKYSVAIPLSRWFRREMPVVYDKESPLDVHLLDVYIAPEWMDVEKDAKLKQLILLRYDSEKVCFYK